MTEIVYDNSAPKFLTQAGPLLYLDEPRNSLMIGLCEGMLRSPSKFLPVLVRVMDGEKTVAAAISTPPMYLILTAMTDEHLLTLADSLYDKKMQFPGVTGPTRETEAFANIWSKLTGLESELSTSLKLHRLDKVIPASPIPKGEMRMASMKDLDLLTDWSFAFAKESLPSVEVRDAQHWRERTERVIAGQLAHVWFVEGKPVSLAFGNRATTNGISIGPVYTPPEHRKNGYASGLVDKLSQKFLDEGKKFCLLYTDATNSTSNKIYKAVGYNEFSESKVYLFHRR